MISVFYDGKCGMCRREIAHYQKIAEAGKFQWVDIARDKDALISFNIAQAEALLYLHALDQSNRVHVGIDAFVLIWNNLPRWWILGLIFRNSVLKKFASKLYIIFAKKRFSKYTHCKIALEQPNRS